MIKPLNYDPKYDALTEHENALLEQALQAIQTFVKQSPEISQVDYATRDAHAKTYAHIKGTFYPEKDEFIPAFGTESSYETCIRISHAHLKIIPTDRQLPLYGVALKIKVNESEEINLPLVNFPVFVTDSVTRFLNIFLEANQLFTAPSWRKPDHLLEILTTLPLLSMETCNKDFFNAINTWRKTFNYFILARNYHSIGAYRMGNYMVKLKAVPTFFDPHFEEGKSIHEQLKNYLANHNFGFKIFYQLAYNENDQPVNKLVKQWKNSPDRLWGTVKLNEVLPNSPALENLHFNPFANPPAHQPVGRIQQLRKKAYETSIETRQAFNKKESVKTR